LREAVEHQDQLLSGAGERASLDELDDGPRHLDALHGDAAVGVASSFEERRWPSAGFAARLVVLEDFVLALCRRREVRRERSVASIAMNLCRFALATSRER
jgi:hypothetical protein